MIGYVWSEADPNAVLLLEAASKTLEELPDMRSRLCNLESISDSDISKLAYTTKACAYYRALCANSQRSNYSGSD